MNKGIQKFYARIWGSYELINSILTLGLDAHWRKKEVKWALKSSRRPGWFLDICSGTGQTAINLGRSLPCPNHIIAADFSPQMLKQADANVHKKKITNISFTLADALQLPFADNSFDAVTISFATRNLDAQSGHLIKAFREFHRVLKPGGCFFNLETSQPPVKIIRILFHLFVKLTVKPIGKLISGSESSYAYLSSSIRSFYPAPGLEKILYETGFKSVTYRRFLFGAAAVHQACK
ncbi:MAG TPA: ubiquinone/menaquinone biosynthesis methyltransferase [Candidatus Deferrimicrobium sp.]|nr:ubiquinone/menaquinone biosynthesis methyltransferase [Candidatus Deferrimicrobium sp.]